MVVAITVDDLVFDPIVLDSRQLAYHLVDLFIGFGTGIGKIHTAHTGHFFNQLFCKHGAGDVAGRVREVAHLDQLITHGIRYSLSAIPNIHRPDASRYRIEKLLAVRICYAHALATHHHGRFRGFESLVLCQMMPNVRLITGNYIIDVYLVTMIVKSHVRPSWLRYC